MVIMGIFLFDYQLSGKTTGWNEFTVAEELRENTKPNSFGSCTEIDWRKYTIFPLQSNKLECVMQLKRDKLRLPFQRSANLRLVCS